MATIVWIMEISHEENYVGTKNVLTITREEIAPRNEEKDRHGATI